MRKLNSAIAGLLATLMLATPAAAYTGPGLGLGVVATVLGVVGSFFLAIFAVLYYPFKRMMKKRAKAKANAGGTLTAATADGAANDGASGGEASGGA
ncbi:MAG: hypothetical protein AAGC56_09060 [Pseudomonadota bacterium]